MAKYMGGDALRKQSRALLACGLDVLFEDVSDSPAAQLSATGVHKDLWHWWFSADSQPSS